MKKNIILALICLLLVSSAFGSFSAQIFSGEGNFTETDTLQSVTDRGSVTSNDINVQGNMQAETVSIGTSSTDAILNVRGSTFPVITGQRTTTSASGLFSVMGLSLVKTSANNPTAGFGPGFIFQGINNVNKVNNIGAVYGVLESWNNVNANAGTGGLAFSVFRNSAIPTTAMSIKSTGNVGIGTTNPVGKLEISDGNSVSSTLTSFFSSNDILQTIEDSTGGLRMISASDTNFRRLSQTFLRARGTLASPSAVQIDDYLGDLLFGGRGTSTAGFGGGVFAYVDGTVGASTVPMRLSFVTGGSSTDRQERMVIKSGGNVGIATNTPNQKLQVIGNVNVSGTIYYGALQANSPHALLEDESGHTRICKKATDGKVVLQTIELVDGIYQSVYKEDINGVCNKFLIKSQETFVQLENVNGIPTYVEKTHNLFENIWTKETNTQITQKIRDSLAEFEINKNYFVSDRFKYQGVAYEVIQEHQSQDNWIPSQLPALYKVLILHDYQEVTEWTQPLGSHDCYPLNSIVTYNGQRYKSLHQCNVWQPPTLWEIIT